MGRLGTWHTGRGIKQCTCRRGSAAQRQRQLAACHVGCPPAQRRAGTCNSAHIRLAELLGQGEKGMLVRV